MSMGADASFMSSQDLRDLYPGESLNMPDRQVFVGLGLSIRRHVTDSFYLGLGMSTLPKAYAVKVSATGEVDNYDWDALYPHLLGGFAFYRGVNSYLYVQGEAGMAFLNQAAYTRSGGPVETKGGYEGSTFATAVGLGGLWLLIPSVGLDVCGGYRRVNFDSASFSLPPGTASINDSGPFLRAQLSFFWGMANPWGEGMPMPQAPPAPLP